ncbi:DUF4097 family beta strand repeat protein [bacterium]|nr:DUF4097 family beta strand repeat protein [candidate division CSSED10-310 bacterium]
MAQFSFEKEITDSQIKILRVKNLRGKLIIKGWDKPSVLIKADIDVPGETVPEAAKPQITTEGDTLLIRSGGGHVFSVEDADFSMDWVSDLSGNIQDLVSNITHHDPVVEAHLDLDDDDDMDDDVDGKKSEARIHMNINKEELLKQVEESKKQFKEMKHALKEHIKEIKLSLASRVRETGQMTTTDIEIYVPAGIELQAKNLLGPLYCENVLQNLQLKNVNGPIRLEGSTGEAKLTSMNGSISFEGDISGVFTAKTMNGPIKLSVNRLQGSMKLKTMNGPIRVVLPPDASAQIHADSASGPVKVSSNITSDLRSRSKFIGSLGSGEFPVQLKTYAGPISIALSETEPSEHLAKPAAPPRPPSPPEVPDPEAASKESPESVINRMVKQGRISPDEAKRLLELSRG